MTSDGKPIAPFKLDTFVSDRNVRGTAIGEQTLSQEARPIVIGVRRGTRAIGDRIAESHECGGVRWREDVDAGEPIQRL